MINSRRRVPRRRFVLRSDVPLGKPRLRRLSSKQLVEIQRRVGEILFKFPLVARQLGHDSPIGTVVDYLHAEDLGKGIDREAASFLIDFLTLSTSDLIKKWYGDDVSPADAIEDLE